MCKISNLCKHPIEVLMLLACLEMSFVLKFVHNTYYVMTVRLKKRTQTCHLRNVHCTQYISMLLSGQLFPQ